VIGGCKNLHKVPVRDRYCAQNVIRLIQYTRTRCVGHVTRTGEKMNVYRTTVGKLKERDHLEDVDVGGG
jgi:hypothetical protein